MPQSPWARAAAPLDLPPGSRGGRPPSRRCSCPRGSRGRNTSPPAPARAAAPYEPPPRSRGGRPPSPSPPPPRREEQPPSQEPSAGPPPAPGLGPLGPLLLHCAHLLRDARLPRPRTSSPSSYPVVKIHANFIDLEFPTGAASKLDNLKGDPREFLHGIVELNESFPTHISVAKIHADSTCRSRPKFTNFRDLTPWPHECWKSTAPSCGSIPLTP